MEVNLSQQSLVFQVFTFYTDLLYQIVSQVFQPTFLASTLTSIGTSSMSVLVAHSLAVALKIFRSSVLMGAWRKADVENELDEDEPNIY